MNRPTRATHATRTLARCVVAAVLSTFVLVAGGGGQASAADARSAAKASGAGAFPTSMSSLGDSITRGFNAAGWFTDWPSRSWSTGTSSSVDSHYARLRGAKRANGEQIGKPMGTED